MKAQEYTSAHRRTGQNFGQLRFFGQQEKIWAKTVFKDVSMFIYFKDLNINLKSA